MEKWKSLEEAFVEGQALCIKYTDRQTNTTHIVMDYCIYIVFNVNNWCKIIGSNKGLFYFIYKMFFQVQLHSLAIQKKRYISHCNERAESLRAIHLFSHQLRFSFQLQTKWRPIFPALSIPTEVYQHCVVLSSLTIPYILHFNGNMPFLYHNMSSHFRMLKIAGLVEI